MNTLEDAWAWYEYTRHQLTLMRRIGRLYWDDVLREGGPAIRDDRFKEILSEDVVRETDFSLEQLDDLAVVVLFSVFESLVRLSVLEAVGSEAGAIRHRALRAAAEEAMDRIATGSFFHVLRPFKDRHADLVEMVDQVRDYRNWVAHGRGGRVPNNLNPVDAYRRLRAFLAVLQGPELSPDPGRPPPAA